VEQIYIGNYSKGLVNVKIPVYIDNDAFPVLVNFYIWRGRAKRKRGTSLLAQMQVQVQIALTPLNWQVQSFALVAGAGNLKVQFGLPLSSTITPGTISLIVGGQTYTDPSPQNGTLTGSGGGTGTINYATGAFTITGGGASVVIGTFSYFPGNPVMGLRDFVASPSTASLPVLLGFDTVYSYQLNQAGIPSFYNVTFYKNTGNPFFWSANDYQLFWTTNYSGALWATNNKPGFNFVSATYISGSGTTAITFNFKSGLANYTGLVIGDILWFNEWEPPDAIITNIPKSAGGGPTVITALNSFTLGQKVSINGVTGMSQINGGPYLITGVSGTTFTIPVDSSNFDLYTGGGMASLDPSSIAVTINGINGTVSNIAGAAAGIYIVTFTNAQTVSGTGIAQLLTNTIVGQDGIKWYDGDPTNSTGFPAGTGLGWVNFAPPLTATSVSIGDLPSDLFYLVGALAIVAFKDRLLFFAPWVQTSVGSPIQLIDTVLWSWNGTPYYNALVPANQTYDVKAYYVDQTGLGGYLSAGISQPITTINNNQDVLLVGFGGSGRKTRFTYTGNDINPFLFFSINSELPSSSTFSGVTLDSGGIDLGTYGITITDQQSSSRIDLDIPDQVFQVQTSNNGLLRVNAIRDFKNEWIYFSYPLANSPWVFPTQTFLFNYRENTWSIFYENFTAHGSFRKLNLFTWATVPYPTWSAWNVPWNAGINSALVPQIIAGNPEGYVLIKDEGTGEGVSGTISALISNGGNTQITSYNHCVTSGNQLTGTGDYIQIQGVLGLLSATITNITNATQAVITAANTFSLSQFITITGVNGMVQINNNSYEIVAVTPAAITINLDTTSFFAYTSGGTATYTFNGVVGQVISTIDANNFVVDIPFPPITYIGLGTFIRFSQPLLQTKQFPVYWEQGSKTRLGVQKYLFDTTSLGQVSVNINLSQDPLTSWNAGTIIPVTGPSTQNNGLEYSQIVYTCPESTNLGLTPANVNLQMPTAVSQSQIWHRLNTSLIGDSIQIGVTLNDSQMRNPQFATDEIVLHAMNLEVEPSSQLV
jgi:hypothetical protein